MPQSWELELLDAVSEYIPGYGELYSFRRAKHASEVGDKESEGKFISTLGIGVVRDALLFGGYLELLPATVLFSATENVAGKISELYWGKSTEKIEIRLPAKEEGKRQAAGEKARHRILIPYKEGETQAQKEKFLKNQTEVAARVYFRHAVFHGKLDYTKTEYHGCADQENLFLIVPDGFTNDAPCQIMTTLTEDYKARNKKRPLIYVSTKMQMDISKGEFKVIPPHAEGQKPYSWFGVITTKDKKNPEGSTISLEMKDGAETITTVTLDLAVNDLI